MNVAESPTVTLPYAGVLPRPAAIDLISYLSSSPCVSNHDGAAARGVTQWTVYTLTEHQLRKRNFLLERRMKAFSLQVLGANLWTSMILIDGLIVES